MLYISFLLAIWALVFYLYFSYPYLSGACHDYYIVSYEMIILDTDWWIGWAHCSMGRSLAPLVNRPAQPVVASHWPMGLPIADWAVLLNGSEQRHLYPPLQLNYFRLASAQNSRSSSYPILPYKEPTSRSSCRHLHYLQILPSGRAF